MKKELFICAKDDEERYLWMDALEKLVQQHKDKAMNPATEVVMKKRRQLMSWRMTQRSFHLEAQVSPVSGYSELISAVYCAMLWIDHGCCTRARSAAD